MKDTILHCLARCMARQLGIVRSWTPMRPYLLAGCNARLVEAVSGVRAMTRAACSVFGAVPDCVVHGMMLQRVGSARRSADQVLLRKPRAGCLPGVWEGRGMRACAPQPELFLGAHCTGAKRLCVCSAPGCPAVLRKLLGSGLGAL